MSKNEKGGRRREKGKEGGEVKRERERAWKGLGYRGIPSESSLHRASLSLFPEESPD